MSNWPELDPSRDHETLAVLHLASQMLGKIRVAHAPWVNHGWHATLRPSAAGLATLPTAAARRPQLHPRARPVPPRHRAAGQRRRLASCCRSRGKTIAQLHRRAGRLARATRAAVAVSTAARTRSPMPCRSPRTTRRAPMTRISATRFHQALQAVVPVFERFRAGFRGKCSPVHFFWGSFDLAVTRFSGRTAPRASGRRPRPARPHHPRSL